MKIKAWILAARLRTLPLSVSGIIVGYAIAGIYKSEDVAVFILALITTILFQIISNFANDYGDGIKGTDNKDRIGPVRALQSGILTSKELKRGIYFLVLLAIVSVIILLYYSFGINNILYFILFGILGLFSIWAAIKYTVGDSAYGYKGLGDFFVFVFFGLVAVMGTMFLVHESIAVTAVLPAVTVGALSVCVLNLNNLRDMESDKKANKNTLIVKIGYENGKRYHFFLLFLSLICAFLFTTFHYKTLVNFCWLLSYIPIVMHVIRVNKVKSGKKIDPELKIIALSTFLFAVLFYFSFNIFS